MPVPAHLRSHRPAVSSRPAPALARASHRPAADRVEIRLPWWAVALPAVAFAALLLMIMSPGQAQAATADPALGQLIERTLHLLAP
ncbi:MULTISPECIES: hypothetical protein [Streptomyces]|uniref:Uncharacterized protein n=1 Tax=Streptomyces cyaneofuscatus TaxID=66883 RepID=A0ABZ1ES09_9ACTN|nr:hypothetical protein [Streptomyces cyaneofuscatus]WSB06912.1 hypothetical protein OG849_06525 [Streptomyces cyaneofuscatus]WSD49553.1 hypothetical protein OG857_28870 [Streptomyces cyaneofuscatus]WTA92977.1 hypothetical protein OG323_30150 [Streptomyces cyaneofuscatus]